MCSGIVIISHIGILLFLLISLPCQNGVHGRKRYVMGLDFPKLASVAPPGFC